MKIVSSDLDLANARKLLTLLLHHLLANFLRETLEQILDSLGLRLQTVDRVFVVSSPWVESTAAMK